MKTLLVGTLGCFAALCGGVAVAAPQTTAAASQEPIKSSATSLELRGLIIPFEQAMLSSRSTGVIKMLKEEGSLIRKDEVVVALEDDLEKASVDSQQAILDKRKWEKESNSKLRSKGGSSEDEALTVEANLKTAQAQLRQAEAVLDKKLVRSPFDGVVVRRIRSPGEAVDQYFNVVNVVNLSKVYLETYLPGSRLKDVQQGEEVQVRMPDLPGRTFTGHIDFISPVTEAASGDFRIKILLPNADGALRSGMSAAASLDVANPETPRAASTKKF